MGFILTEIAESFAYFFKKCKCIKATVLLAKFSMPLKVLEPHFVYSVPDIKLMKNLGDEVAVIGRSNSGKSSLINALCMKKDLAKTSKTPGRTRHAVVYKFGLVESLEPNVIHLVDLPGYGYAKMSKSEALACEKLIKNYLQKRVELKLVFILLDIRREPEEREIIFLKTIKDRGISVALILTKCDKIPLSQRKPTLYKVAKQLDLSPEEIFIHSKEMPKKTDELRKTINRIIRQPKYLGASLAH